jgi:hypothetical protein
MVVSTFHLRVFLASRPELELAVDDLRGLLEARGATVIESSLPVPDHMSPHARRAVEGQFRAWFTEDALLLWPADLLLQRYARDHRHIASTPAVAPASTDSKALAADTRAIEVARALFGASPDGYRARGAEHPLLAGVASSNAGRRGHERVDAVSKE